MAINSGGGGRPGRVNPQAVAYRRKEKAKKQHRWRQNDYDVHKYDGTDPGVEAVPV